MQAKANACSSMCIVEYKVLGTFLAERLAQAARGGRQQRAGRRHAAEPGRAEQARERVRAHVEVRAVQRAHQLQRCGGRGRINHTVRTNTVCK